MSKLYIDSSYNSQDTINFRSNEKVALSNKKLDTTLDISSISKYINYKVNTGKLDCVEFIDDILERKDARLLVRYLGRLSIDKVIIRTAYHRFVEWKDILAKYTNITVIVKLPTVVHETYSTLFQDCSLSKSEFENELKELRKRNVEVELTTLNSEDLKYTIGVLRECESNITIGLPNFFNNRDIQSNSILGDIEWYWNSLVKALIDISNKSSITITNVPVCIGSLTELDVCLNDIHINHCNLSGYVLSPKGLHKWTDYFTQYATTDKCSDCDYNLYCPKLPLNFK